VDDSIPLPADTFAPRDATRSADVCPLVEAARRGDAAAFDEIYRRYSRMVHGLLLARVSAADADDLLQDVFLQAWRLLPSLREPAALGAWLAAIARHRAVDHVRARPPAADPLDDRAGAWPTADERLRAECALAAIRALPEAYREPLMLRLVEGMTGPEIAARTGLTPGSVRVNLCRGMKLLRERLARGDGHGR
jgi:RNA polymerase sigma-70 factor (ECF subfamily)